jgi:hypothetical protein
MLKKKPGQCWIGLVSSADVACTVLDKKLQQQNALLSNNKPFLMGNENYTFWHHTQFLVRNFQIQKCRKHDSEISVL